MKVVVSDDFGPHVLELFRETGAQVVYKPESLEDALSDASVLVVRSATRVTAELVSGAPRLKLVARGGVGLDNVDIAACKARGIEVVNTPGVSTNAVAELAIGLMVCALRGIPRGHLSMKQGRWEKKSLMGSELEGRTLGLIGCGRIGSLVGMKARALGMKVIGYNPPPRHDESIDYVDSLDELFSASDIISLHVPSSPSTDGMINAGALSMMKDGVVIINTSRGQVVDEDALYDACKSGKVGTACLDVYSQEPYKGKLLELDNVIFTPHIGASTLESQERIGIEISRKIRELMG